MCEGINCGIGGDCLSGNCTCQTGYTNVENFCEETCVFTPCENNGTCIVTIINDIPTPECECPVNYAGTTCNLDLCSDIQCGNGICIGGNCQCDEGYANIENFCVDLCEGVDCGNGGTCSSGNCDCQVGYAKIGNTCEELIKTTHSHLETTSSPTVNAVLILSTANSNNVPMVVDFDGQ